SRPAHPRSPAATTPLSSRLAVGRRPVGHFHQRDGPRARLTPTVGPGQPRPRTSENRTAAPRGTSTTAGKTNRLVTSPTSLTTADDKSHEGPGLAGDRRAAACPVVVASAMRNCRLVMTEGDFYGSPATKARVSPERLNGCEPL